jgi:hypothetical protein
MAGWHALEQYERGCRTLRDFQALVLLWLGCAGIQET